MRTETGGSGVSVKLTTAGAGGPPPSLWKTATPYLFLSLAFMMGIIVVALLVLICTRKKGSSSSSSTSRQEAEAAVAAAFALAPLDREPKVVVFMPGDHAAPSFFLASAKPLGGDDGAVAV